MIHSRIELYSFFYIQAFFLLRLSRKILVIYINNMTELIELIKKNVEGCEDIYNLLLESQDYGCAICGSKETGSHHTKYFSVDHDHKTGKVRGLLCFHCNTGIDHCFKQGFTFTINSPRILS